MNIAGTFLAASTAVELAALLFTEGPDEEYKPVILALAATALLLGGSATTGGTQWAEVAGLVATVGLLIAMTWYYPQAKRKLTDAKDRAEEPAAEGEAASTGADSASTGASAGTDA